LNRCIQAAAPNVLTMGYDSRMKSITHCPCCAAAATPWASARDNRSISCESFDYYRCSGCGLVFIDPVPADLTPFYEGGYQPIPSSLAELRKLAAQERYRLAPIASKSGGDLLEIGPWIGLFAINAKDAGFNVDVIEMSPAAAQFLRDVVGIGVTQTDDVKAALLATDKQYDVIALWHSLEHLEEPWSVLAVAARRLKPDGILLVAIPNIAGAQSRWLGARWLHLDAPRHLYFWPPNDLATLMNRLGLETVDLDTTDHLSAVLSRNAWEFYFWSKLKRIRYVRTVVAKILAPLFSLLTQRRGRGAGITATFRATPTGDSMVVTAE
jgi:SAM-dependent methyltransferase